MKNRIRIVGAFALLSLTHAAVPGDSLGANQIFLQGVVSANCTIDVTADPAALMLPLTAAGLKRIRVGTVQQSCNKKSGYALLVESANCAVLPTGAKVSDAVSGEHLAYSVEFDNPNTGGSQSVVTGLLANACSDAIGRSVTNAKIVSESSEVYVAYTGSSLLAAGTYQDTLTITLNLK
jgi:hypothetical protein